MYFFLYVCVIFRETFGKDQLRDQDAVLWESVLCDSGRGSREGQDDGDDVNGEGLMFVKEKPHFLMGL